ncbi:MAG: FAD-dependent oxidoreductase [Saprospiraceae bacterium]
MKKPNEKINHLAMNLTTGYPYWLIKNGLPENYPKLNHDIKTDIVIIGGGISGALTSYYLVNAGLHCTLVDARTIGLGSTCASTSLLQYELDKPLKTLTDLIGWSSASRVYQLCGHSIDTLEHISKKIKFKHFTKRPSLFFAAHTKDNKLLLDESILRKKAGFDVIHLNQSEIINNYGFSAPSGILSAQAASTDAYMLTHALLKESSRKGLTVFDRTSIQKIKYHSRSVQLIAENGCCISAKKIVNASGYEITEFINKQIVSLHSTYALASEHIEDHNPIWKDNVLLWNTADPYLYLRITDDNRIMVGGRDEQFYNPKKRDKLISHKSSLLKKDFLKLFPALDFKTEFTWTGTFGTTKDALPYIGTYHKTPHTYYALGFGGNGITFSVIAAEIIRDLILGKKNKNAGLFSFAR